MSEFEDPINNLLLRIKLGLNKTCNAVYAYSPMRKNLGRKDYKTNSCTCDPEDD